MGKKERQEINIKRFQLSNILVLLEETNILWRNGSSTQVFQGLHRKSWILREFPSPQYTTDQKIIHFQPEPQKQ